MKSILIPKELHERLKKTCLYRKINIKEATIEAIDHWITSTKDYPGRNLWFGLRR